MRRRLIPCPFPSLLGPLPWVSRAADSIRLEICVGTTLSCLTAHMTSSAGRIRRFKFHGQRIELGEVEHHLAGIPGIVVSMVALPGRGCFKGKSVAVMQMCGASPSPRISQEPIELAVGHPLPPLDKVKNGLARHLSRHMVPAEFIFITNLPFLSSCKVD